MTLCVCRSGRHEVYIVRGEALAQRLLQLLQVLDVAGGSRLPDRLQRRRHQRALPRVRQSLDDVTPRTETGGNEAASETHDKLCASFFLNT